VTADKAAIEVRPLADGEALEALPKGRRGLLTALEAERARLARALEAAQARILDLEKLVDEDPLIPVANRRAFVRELTRMIAFAERYGMPASIVYFDVDNLKRINDVHGHAAGDAALAQLARILLENVRATDIVGRLGGDELAVLLVRTDKELGESKGAELAAAIEAEPVRWQNHSLCLTVAYGVYALVGGENADAVLAAADREMYRRKAPRR
jgi:diguanylate cyclase (GGDEF)-like protein